MCKLIYPAPEIALGRGVEAREQALAAVVDAVVAVVAMVNVLLVPIPGRALQQRRHIHVVVMNLPSKSRFRALW